MKLNDKMETGWYYILSVVQTMNNLLYAHQSQKREKRANFYSLNHNQNSNKSLTEGQLKWEFIWTLETV